MPAKQPLDLIGYETLIEEIIRREGLLALPGDIVEIGTLMGGGTIKLAEFLSRESSAKRIWTIDLFNTDSDPTVNEAGRSMSDIYRCSVPTDGSWRSTVERAFSSYPNIRIIQGDSNTVTIPVSQICLAVIDGDHREERVVRDFERCWKRLAPGGIVAMHDFEGDLPGVTRAIRHCLEVHESEIESVRHIPHKWLISIRKKP